MKKIQSHHIHIGMGWILIALGGFIVITLLIYADMEVAALEEYTMHLNATLPETAP